jgi:hypothetical protein
VPEDMLENPVTKERMVVHPGGRDVLRLEVRVPVDMIRPPLHLHRGQREHFGVLDGEVTVQVRKDLHGLGAPASPSSPARRTPGGTAARASCGCWPSSGRPAAC